MRLTIARLTSVPSPQNAIAMDKKAKKKIEVLRQRIQKLQQQLSGAKSQMDDPDEVRRLEDQIAAAKVEVEELKAS